MSCDGHPADDHDPRCLTWHSENVEDCDCDDVDGHAQLIEAPTIQHAITWAFPCDSDGGDAA